MNLLERKKKKRRQLATRHDTRVRQVRLLLGYTQQQFADKCGVGLSTVKRWEAWVDEDVAAWMRFLLIGICTDDRRTEVLTQVGIAH